MKKKKKTMEKEKKQLRGTTWDVENFFLRP